MADNNNTERVMRNAYYTIKHPGSFGGVLKLQQSILSEDGVKISLEKVRDFLEGENTYTLHKPVRKTFLRNRVFVSGPLKQYQADLVDMTSLSKHNKGMKWLLTVIDVFSKKAYAKSIKNKTAASVTKAFGDILRESQESPEALQTDSGSEFFNRQFKTLMTKYQIRHFATKSEQKACVVERFNKTLRGRMFRYFTAKNTNKYIDILQDLLDSYNNSFHKSIKMTPNQVNMDNKATVFNNLYGSFPLRKKKLRVTFKIGDHVRISKAKGVFTKGYPAGWSTEIFLIHRIIPREPTVYKITDLDGEEIQGVFYTEELQRIRPLTSESFFSLDKILKRRVVKSGDKKIIQYYVSWLNWPSKFNSWVNASDIKRLN